MMWALDPWSEAAIFLPVPDDVRMAYCVPDPGGYFLPTLWGQYPSCFYTPRYIDTWRREFRSPALGCNVAVYVSARDEPRLLRVLQVAERVLMLFSLIGGER